MVRREVVWDGGAGLGGVGFGLFAGGVRIAAVVGVGCVAALICGCANSGKGGDRGDGLDAGVAGLGGGSGVVHRGEVEGGGGVHDGGGDGRVASNRPMRLTDSEAGAASDGAGGGSTPAAVAAVPAPAPEAVPEPVPEPLPVPVPEPVESAASVWRPGWWHEAATWTGGRIAVCRFADAGDMLQARTDAIYACLDAIELAGGDRSNVVVERADTQRLDDGTFRMFVRVTAPRVSGR